MAPRIAVGIDIGSHLIKVIVAEATGPEQKHKPKVIGIGYADAKGLRHGYIISEVEASQSIKQAIAQAEKTSGYKISKAYVALGGLGLSSGVFGSTIAITDKDGEITAADSKKVLEQCESELPESFTLNRQILHVVPLSWKIDNKSVLGKPTGMKGSKLEVKALIVSCLAQHIDDIIDALAVCGVEVEDVLAAPLAASLSTLNKAQQVAGCALLNIGAETVSISVFENGAPISLEIFPIGSNDITNDIALGLKISLEDADRVKLSKPESVPYPRKKLEEIITARLSDIFDLVESHLKRIGKNGLLPAGIIMTGGGAVGPFLEETAKSILKLPAKKASIKFDGESKLAVKDGSWAVAYGLCILGVSSDDTNSPVNRLGLRFVATAKSSIWQWIKKILP